jgi:hypothetical protein
MTPVESIATALKGKRTSGGWLIRCPAHVDSNPSCIIKDGDRPGRLLVHWPR